MKVSFVVTVELCDETSVESLAALKHELTNALHEFDSGSIDTDCNITVDEALFLHND